MSPDSVPRQTADEHRDGRKRDKKYEERDELPFLHSKPLSMECRIGNAGRLLARYAVEGRVYPSEG